MNHAPQIDVGYHVPVNPDVTVLCGLLVWCLWGLWIYLDARWRGESGNSVLLLLSGPAAWLTATWNRIHRRPKRTQGHWEHWGRN